MNILEVHPLSSNPTEAWEEMRKTQHVMRFKVKIPKDPPPENKIRLVCMSDTHSLTSHIKKSIPHGDILIHAGDFTRSGSIKEVREFNSWLGTLTHKHKLIIAGNHELTMDEKFRQKHQKSKGLLGHRRVDNSANLQTYLRGGVDGKTDDPMEELMIGNHSKEEIQKELTNGIYLEDSSVTLYGLKIYGTPWQPEFGGWAFNLPRGAPCMAKWDLIPSDTDILITHSPPVGYGDHCCTGVRAGCVELLNTVQQRVKPKYHIYGHIHEGYGVRSDGKIVFINASTCDINYMPNNRPVVTDVNIPEGFSRDTN